MFAQIIMPMLTPVLTGAVVTFAFGYLWYGVVFAKQWMSLSGRMDMGTPTRGAMVKSMLIKFLMNILIAAGVFLVSLIPQSLKYSFIVTSFAYIGFVFTHQIDGYLWGGHSFKLVMFDTAYQVLSFVLLVTTMFYMMQRVAL